MDSWDYIKLKSFCTAKKQSIDWIGKLWNGRKYLQTMYLIKRLIPKIHRELLYHNSQKKKKPNLIKKWAKDLNGHFSKDIQLSSKYIKIYSTSLIKREMQMKTTRRYHLRCIKMATIKKPKEGFPGGTVVKNLPANAGNMGSSPGPGRSHMLWSN